MVRAQFPDLHPILQTPDWLKRIGSLIGEVVSVEGKAKSCKRPVGPIVNILVPQTDRLPATLITPNVSCDAVPGAKIRQRILYSGLPNQCNRCRKFGHETQACKLPPAQDPTGEGNKVQDQRELDKIDHGQFTKVKRKRI